MSQCMSLITKLSVTLPASFFADLSDAHRLLCVFVAVVLRERYRGSQGTSDPSPSVLDTLPCSGGFLESDLQWQPSPAVLTSVFQTIQAHFNVNPVTIRGSAKPAAERAQASVFLACVWHTGAAHELSVLAAEVVAGKLPSPRSVAASLHAPFMASLQAMCHVQAYGEQVVIWRHLLDEVRGTVRASGDGDAAVVEPKKLLLDRIRDLNDTSLQRICELQSVVFLPQDPGSCIGRLVDKAAVLLSATDMQDSSPAACYASVADDIVSRADLLMKFSSAALASSGDGHNAVSNKLVRSASKTHTTSLQHSASFSRAQSVRALAPTQLARSATESSHDAFSSSELSSTGFVSTAMQQVELHRVLSSGSLTVADRPSATASLAGYASDMVSLGLCIERRRGLNAVPVLNVQAAVAQLCLDLTCPPVAELANLAQARKSLATCRLDSLHSLNVLLSRSPRLPDSIIVDVLAITCVTVAAPSTDCFDGIRGAGLPVLQELVLARAQVWTTILSIACDEKSADFVVMSCVRFLRQQLLPCDALVLSNSKALTQLAERLTLPSPHVVLVELFWSLCWTVLSWATVVRMDATAWQLESMFRAVSLVQTSALECVAKFMAHALVAPDLSEAGAGARTSKLRSDPPSDSKDDAPFEQESKDDTSFCASRFASVGMPQSASSSHGSVWQGLLMFLGARHTQAGVAFLQCDAAVILAIRLFRLTRMFCLKVQRLLIRFLRDVLTCASASAIETALLMVDADFTLADFCQMLLEFIGHSLVGDNVVASEPLPSETPNSLSPAVSAPAMMHIVQRLFAKDGASHLELPDVDEKMWSLCIRKTSAASDCTARVFMEASMDAVISAIGSPDSTESSGMSWPARGWHGGREELDDFVLSGLERYACLYMYCFRFGI